MVAKRNKIYRNSLSVYTDELAICAIFHTSCERKYRLKNNASYHSETAYYTQGILATYWLQSLCSLAYCYICFTMEVGSLLQTDINQKPWYDVLIPDFATRKNFFEY